ncbi:hypothetical protein [Campylobacter iguaniorum]|uniref:hypothetical protein n=1 Tax=Campylobacter iguaniorum TaxID=1244531 RepID=UPI0007C8FC0E|nr:hypothetical protein [Campylobacter iguaniorum]
MTVNYAKNEKMNLDPISAMSKVWSFFSKLTSNAIDVNSETLSQAQIVSLPAGFDFTGNLFGDLTNIIKTVEDNMPEYIKSSRGSIQSLSGGQMYEGFSNFFGSSSSGVKYYSPDANWFKDLYKETVCKWSR